MLWSLETVSLPGRREPRLKGVTLNVPPGVTAVIGQSGAGKTSLLNLLVGFERPASGTIRFLGVSSTGRTPIYWAPPQHGLWPHLTVREHLTTVQPVDLDPAAATCDELLEQFDLLNLAAVRPDSLSLGERSRLSVARSLHSGAGILVMDEPLSHVDLARCHRYWGVIREVCRSRGISLVFSTHLPDVVLREANHVICLSDGQLAYSGSVTQLYDSPESRELAMLLGPCNWLPSEELEQWCDLQSDSAADAVISPKGHCVRPERLVVESVAQSPLSVEESRYVGTLAEVGVRDERDGNKREFVYRPRGHAQIRRGERVVLKILSLLALLVLTGCSQSGEPQISVKHEASWLMRPDGPRVPAPRGMTVSADDEYLVLDNAGRVLVYDHSGEISRQWWMPDYAIGKAEGICVLKDHRIAVADTHYHRIVFFDHEGNVTGTVGKFGSQPGDFVYPVKITQDPDENLYVCEYGQNDRVQKFRPDGTFVLQFGGPGTEPGQFQRPSGIVWFDHRLFVVDAFNNRIQVFSDEGKFIEVLGQSDNVANLRYPYDITIDKNGDLFVVEYGANRVSKFSRDGRLLGRYGKSGRGQAVAELTTPWGVAIDRRNRLYVCDTGNRRIVELEL